MKKTDRRKYKGRTQTLEEWARECGLPWLTLYHRLATGYTMDEALHTPFRKKRGKVEVDGRAVNLRKLAAEAGLPYITVWKRVVKRGWDLDLALSTPSTRRNRYVVRKSRAVNTADKPDSSCEDTATKNSEPTGE